VEESAVDSSRAAADAEAAPAVAIDAPEPGVRIITPFGEVDAHTAPGLRQIVVDQLGDPAVRQLIVDLSRTTFLDSSALGVLIGALKRMRERGGRLDVVRPPLAIRRIFEVTALDRVLTMRDSREDALAAGDTAPADARG
jgi:anti-sigma B factor antagonist